MLIFLLTKQKSMVVLLSNNLNTSLYWDRQPFSPFQDLPFVLLLTFFCLFTWFKYVHSSYFQTPLRPTKRMTRVFWQFTLPICWCSLLYNWKTERSPSLMSNKHQTCPHFGPVLVVFPTHFYIHLGGEMTRPEVFDT